MMETSTLIVKVIEARNVAPMDRSGTSDPYCRLKCNFNKQRFKTKVIDKTLNPRWDETFKFFAPYPIEGQLKLKMWDKDKWKRNDFLGDIEIDVAKFADGKSSDMWIPLNNEPKVKKDAPGEVRILVTYEDGRSKKPNLSATSQTNRTISSPMVSPAAPLRDHTPTLEDSYEIGKDLGRGGFSVVKKGKNRKNGEDVAVKCIKKKNLKKEELQLLTREIAIMQKLTHPNIIQLFEVFDTPTDLFLVLEYVPGGELFDQIVERGTYSERDAALLISQVLEGVKYMHSHGVVHRDLKPENLLCANEHSIKIADFGLSKDTETGFLQTACGTPSYVAPEVLSGKPYNSEVDIWSIGVITYVLLCGATPFYDAVQSALFKRIMAADYKFHSPEWDDVSHNAKDFVSKMLVVNPANRLSAEQALQHPWISEKNAKRELLKTFKSVQDGLRWMKEEKKKEEVTVAGEEDDDEVEIDIVERDIFVK